DGGQRQAVDVVRDAPGRCRVLEGERARVPQEPGGAAAEPVAEDRQVDEAVAVDVEGGDRAGPDVVGEGGRRLPRAVAVVVHRGRAAGDLAVGTGIPRHDQVEVAVAVEVGEGGAAGAGPF